MHDPEKSDAKPTNKAGRPAAEPVEPRPGTKGNADQQSTHRTQSRVRVTQALDRVREAARQRKKGQFTALLHHINADTLRTAFYALKRKAAPGVDGITWHDYEADLEPRTARFRRDARAAFQALRGSRGQSQASRAWRRGFARRRGHLRGKNATGRERRSEAGEERMVVGEEVQRSVGEN